VNLEIKGKAFILFPDTWLSYSPSIINLVKVMKVQGWNVTLVAFHDGSYQKTDEIEVLYVIPSRIMRRIVGCLKLFTLYRLITLSIISFKFRKQQFDMVVGVDSLGYFITRLFFDNPIYYSLHIRKSLSQYISKKLGIARMIIQTKERLDLTFSGCVDKPKEVWFIQNSPILDGSQSITNRNVRHEFNLIYFGNVAKNTYGIENFIAALRHLPTDVKLTLKGPASIEYKNDLEAEFSDLIHSGRLSFDSEYISQEDVITWLKRYDLGFCFYDEGLILRADPNIISAPSGKMFNYLAAGLPVIGSKISGLQILSDFAAGILLVDQKPQAISVAVMDIRRSYEAYRIGCRRAALSNDFRLMAERFLAEFSIPRKLR
jgi:glycosyltransferase involved in cell wall biosynthesis